MAFWLILILILLLIFFRPRPKGYLGEKAVENILATLPKDQYVIHNNLMFKTNYGTTQIDHIVVSIFGIFVIETKNYKGWIFGNERDEYWTQNIYRKKTRFKNPIRQNYGHVKAIENHLGHFEGIKIIPIVAFSGRNNLKLNLIQENVICFSELKKLIESYSEYVMPFEKVLKIGNVLEGCNITDKENRKDHIKTIRSNINIANSKIANDICPKCGGNLVKRNGKYGSFIGCGNYPKCRFTTKV